MNRQKAFGLCHVSSWLAQRLGRRTISYSACVFNDRDAADASSIVKPWYVAEAEKQSAKFKEDEVAQIPICPAGSPNSLKRVVEYSVREMGLKDVTIIDRRDVNTLSTGTINADFMVVGTGTSTRHLQSAGLQLLTWLKKEFQVYAQKEGILTTNFLRLHQRRQRRKQQRQRLTNDSAPELLQRVGSWIAIDTKLDSVYVHLMTQERRDELDLEHLGDELAEESASSENGDEGEYVIPQKASGSNTTGRRGFHTEARSIPNTREELALQNILTEPNEDLTEDSAEVRDFVQHFPRLPSRLDWKYRLRFFAVACIQSPSFSLNRLISEAECQQDSGFVLDNDDIETVLSSVCYHAQSHFAQMTRDEQSLASWEQLCDYKARLISRLFDAVIQPTGRSLVLEPRLLVLLYRTFAGPSKNSVSPEQALASAAATSTQRLDMFFDRRRLYPIRLLLEETPETMNIQTTSMLLASLINGESFDAFWKIVNLANVASGSDKQLNELVTELALALVVKSGEQEQIVHGVQTFLPNMLLRKGIDLTPTLIAIVESALVAISPGRNDGFASLRLLLEKHRKNNSQLE